MGANQIQPILDAMDPEEALAALARAAKKLLSHLGEEARLRFLVNLLGDSADDKVGSMVHLWLATCMGEGVDPTKMCQSLMEKMRRRQQLLTTAEPELLVLFEDWLEALEDEAVSLVQDSGSLNPPELARKLGLSPDGATFLINKLRKEGKL